MDWDELMEANEALNLKDQKLKEHMASMRKKKGGSR